MQNYISKLKNLIIKLVTAFGQTREISKTRDIPLSETRDMKPFDSAQGKQEKIVMDSLSCPYCQSTRFVKKGFRVKVRETVQLYLCSTCHKVFTPYTTKGKHYPLAVMLDAISIYIGTTLQNFNKPLRF